MIENTDYLLAMQQLLIDAIDYWPEFDCEDDVNGGDLVDWFAEFRARAKKLVRP